MTEPDKIDPSPGETDPESRRSAPTVSGLKQVTLTEEPGESDTVHSTVKPTGSAADPYIGKTVDGRYYVEALLGEGGMGVVYRCRHTIIDKKVAMKILRADMANNEEVTERFLNEARSASSIGNPHIIDIADFGRLPDGATYFIMEFLTGTSLAQLVEAREPLPPARAGHIVLQLTEGLAAAHDAGIVHRDLKPDNIFLVQRGSQEDFVKILDFGIAKASTNNTALTQAGQVFGTPHYMSPEQASGSEVDLRSDIYALGVILYELLTGQLPFDADNFMAILTQHMYKSPPPPSQVEGLTHQLPPGLEDVILRCLAKETTERYQTMAELGEDIESVFAGTLPRASREIRGVTDSYGSPEEYFERRSAISSPGNQPQPAPNIGLYAAIGSLAALAAGTAVYFATSSLSKPTSEPLAVAAEAAPSLSDAASSAEPAAAETPLKKTPVAIAVAPLAAHVFHGERDLGQSPIMVEVGTEPLVLSARLQGYKDRTLTIDGSEPKVSVELEAEIAKKVAPAPLPTGSGLKPKPKPKAKPRVPSSPDLVDPWE